MRCCAVGGYILRDGAEPVIGPRYARTRWRLLRMRSETLLVRSAATPRVSNHVATGLAARKAYLALTTFGSFTTRPPSPSSA